MCLLLLFIQIEEYLNAFFFVPQPLSLSFFTMLSLNCRVVQFGRDLVQALCSKQSQLWDHSFLLYVVIKNPHKQQHSWYTFSSWTQSSHIYKCEKWIFLLVEMLLKIVFWYHLARGFGLKSRGISWQKTIRINCIVSLQYCIKSELRRDWGEF